MPIPASLERAKRYRLTTGDAAVAALDKSYNIPEIKALKRAYEQAILTMAQEVSVDLVTALRAKGVTRLPFAETWRKAWEELIVGRLERGETIGGEWVAAWVATGAKVADHYRDSIFKAGGTLIERDYALTDYIVRESGKRITLMSEAQLEAFRASFRDLMLADSPIHPRSMAKHLQGIVGLDVPRARAVTKQRLAWEAAGVKGEKLDGMVARLQARAQKKRLTTIARHESADAWAQASRDVVDGPWRRGEFARGTIRAMEFYTSLDERVCPICGPLHGTVNLWDEAWTFELPGGKSGTAKRPPIHVQCRCIEIATLITP